MHSWQTVGAVSSVSFVRPVMRRHYRWTSSTTTLTAVGVTSAIREVLDDAPLHLGGDLRDVGAVVDDDMHLDLAAHDAAPRRCFVWTPGTSAAASAAYRASTSGEITVSSPRS